MTLVDLLVDVRREIVGRVRGLGGVEDINTLNLTPDELRRSKIPDKYLSFSSVKFISTARKKYKLVHIPTPYDEHVKDNPLIELRALRPMDMGNSRVVEQFIAELFREELRVEYESYHRTAICVHADQLGKVGLTGPLTQSRLADYLEVYSRYLKVHPRKIFVTGTKVNFIYVPKYISEDSGLPAAKLEKVPSILPEI